jgi:glycosyltransferase involved in cell wall biosynthesis
MRIACYALAYNEEIILPQFIEHYKKFCDKIVIYDNMSTDNTKEIALDNGCEVISWEAPGGGLNDQCYLEIKQNCYKKDREDFDWVIVADSDELYSHKDGVDSLVSCLEKYKQKGVTLPKVQGYNMVGEDENNLDIFKITKGAKDVSYSKRCIFDPALDMKWSFGCHPQYGEGLLRGVPGVVESADTEILMYHYKYINLQYVFDRHDSYNKRLSDFNKAYKLGVHYSYEKNKIREEYASILNEAEEGLKV